MRIAVVTMSFPVESEAWAVAQLAHVAQRGLEVDVYPLLDRGGRDLSGLLEDPMHGGRLRTCSPDTESGAPPPSAGLGAALWLLGRILGFFLCSPLGALKALYLLPRMLWVQRRIAAGGYDLVHCYWGHHPASVGALCHRSSQLPVTTSIISYDLDSPAPCKRWMYRRAARVITQSQANVGRMQERLGEGPVIDVIHHGVVPAVDGDANPTARSAQLQLVFAGRLLADKGVLEVLDVFAQLRESVPDLQLLIAGDGPMRSAVQQRCSQLQVGESVAVPGFLEQERLFEAFQRCHFVLLPSRKPGEILPNVLKEAMLRGAIPLVYPGPGIEDLVVDASNGFVVDSAAQMAAAIAEAWSDAETMAVLSKAAAAHVAEHFAIDDCSAQLEQSWRRATGSES